MKSRTIPVQRWLAYLALLGMVAVLALPLPATPVLADLPPEEDEPEVKLVGYYVATGEEIEEAASPLHAPPVGELLESVSLDSPHAPEMTFSEIVSRTNTTEYPYRTTARLKSTWSGTGNLKSCSGVMIDPFWVVTSGNCVHDIDAAFGGWATSVEVTPAMDRSYAPYDSSYADHFWSWTTWTQEQQDDWDLAYLHLYRPVGALSGWVGLGYNSSDAFYKDNTFENCGYPWTTVDSNPYAWYMHCWEGEFGWTNTHRVSHLSNLPHLSTYGMSGSPALWYSASTGWDAWAIYSREFCCEGCFQHYTRITQAKFDDIYEKVNDQTPGQPDLIPMDAEVDPAILNAGETLDSMSFRLHNYSSSSWSGTVNLQILLSSDGTITADDTVLETTTWTGSLGAKNSQVINVSSGDLPTMPISAAGHNWIGILLTSTDANNDNNGMKTPDSAPVEISGVTEEGIRSIDLKVSLYKPATTAQDRAPYEQIMPWLARGIYEMSNGTHKLRGVAFYDNGRNSQWADVLWVASKHPSARVSGFGEGRPGQINFGDIFPDGAGPGIDIDFLDVANRCMAGVTLAHEMGHHYYGLYDEYIVTDDHPTATNPGDGVQNSVMNNQFAACSATGGGGDYAWLNFSVKADFDAATRKTWTNQWKVFGASSWETLARHPSHDPPTDFRRAQFGRDFFSELQAVAPTGTSTSTIELPGGLNDALSQYNGIEWIPSTVLAAPAAAYQATVVAVPSSNVKYPEPVPLMASVRGEELLTKVGVEATVSGPEGSSPLTLKDDGVAPDAVAGDGLYSGFMPYDQDGAYYVAVNFDNDAGTAETTELSHAHTTKLDGSTWVPDPRPVTESFNATANTTVVVSGVQDDDHGDAPIEATTLVANNVGVPGQIDHAGDKDVFVVTPSAKGEIIVRLSGFAFGMKPKIRLLHSNAVTVLDSFTFTPAEGTYFSTRLDVKADDPFYVEVQHTNSGATQGLYDVSAGWTERSYQETIKARVYLPMILRK